LAWVGQDSSSLSHRTECTENENVRLKTRQLMQFMNHFLWEMKVKFIFWMLGTIQVLINIVINSLNACIQK
jgi:hypothetical protein